MSNVCYEQICTWISESDIPDIKINLYAAREKTEPSKTFFI